MRKQIVVPPDVDARIRRLAARKGTSQSAVIVEAVRALPEERTQIDQMMDFAGIVAGAPRRLSEEVDPVLSGQINDSERVERRTDGTDTALPYEGNVIRVE